MNKLREKYSKKYLRFLKENGLRCKSQSKVAISWNFHCYSVPCSYALPFNNVKDLKSKYINFIIEDLTNDCDLILSDYFSKINFSKFKPFRKVKFSNSKDYIYYSIKNNKIVFLCEKIQEYIENVVNSYELDKNVYRYLVEKFY